MTGAADVIPPRQPGDPYAVLARSREVGPAVIALFVVAQTALVTILVVYRMELLVPIALATGWVVHPDLVAHGLMLLVSVGVVMFWIGGLRPAEVGLRRADVPAAVVVTLGFWIVMQLVMLVAVLAAAEGVTFHPVWQEQGVVPMLGFLVAMIFGAGLNEEVGYRGFLFPQVYHRVVGAGRARLITAAILSQVLFALMHVPTRLLVAEMTGAALAQSLLVLTFAGLLGVVIYLRTGNLLVVVGIHALVNAPSPLFASPVTPFTITVVLTVLLLLAWPRLARPRRQPGEAQPEHV